MLKIILPVLASFTLSWGAWGEPLTIERIFADPGLSGSAPQSLKFSPDGQRVTFLKGKQADFETLDLWEYHIASGKTRLLVDSALLQAEPAELSDEEKARRERRRISSHGIIEYFWSEDGKALLFPLGGDIYYYQLASGKARQLTATEAFETDPKLSPLGNYLSFIREQNLYVINIGSGKETQLTTDGSGTVSNGMAEFVAQEEMGRYTGYWWAPDESRLAYMQVDEAAVDVITRSEIYAESIKTIEQRYPRAGTTNAAVKLGVIAVSGGDTRWIAEAGDGYLPRVKWLNDSKRLSHQWQSRSQQELKLLFTDVDSGKQQTILTEHSTSWINLSEPEDLHFLQEKEQFIWASERDGFKHYYLYSNDGTLQHQITAGQWMTGKLAAVNEATDIVYFTANAESPLEQHLYSTGLQQNGPLTRLTQPLGYHQINFAKDGSSYIDSYSTAISPPRVSLHRADGEHITFLEENRVDSKHPLHPYMEDWILPEFGSLKNDQGVEFYYRLYKPVGYDRGGRFPTIVFVYGGPGVQLVTDQWSTRASHFYLQYLAQQGYVVFTLDNRGSSGRGTAFETPIYESMGSVEIDDQITGVQFLRSLPFVDPAKIGIYGHSYGGYMSLMGMFKAGDYFSAGVAGAPVTQWDLYDTHYTERYMGDPKSNAAGYTQSDVFPHVEGLKGELMIYHGMADDNVLFTHSTKLYKTLQDKSLMFEMIDYPGKKHSIRGKATGIHLHRSISRFFDRNLKGQ